ncbi:Shikimate dehydrogenase (NADP(+)) [Rhodovastum atsumiense]|uniref:Shikimate dehydrogenase (NADP(+)) n=1 Tax=Rhodovastum atsumiense TaxID=504468 RepID=A0A5M6J2A7_9PROT|nr:shikimate dehydrogenase [Rhodovastum atsumiense]KAA5614722.1 shikimate dehydrogenase [Rhodovastum atsumiense]CAH2599741.1 Shikimate dehydrogenase (NADP(+)) [Rhodovastum atsumiense]
MSDPKPFRAAGLIGWPVHQSRSPMLHQWWLRQYGIAGTYIPMPVRPGEVETALRGLAALGFAGCNVTLPHKEAAARAVDRVDAVGRRMGAINLVVVEADGSLSGYNKDGYGFLESLREAKADWRAESGPAVVLGAGGGARSVVVSLLDSGAPEVRLLNRTRARAEELAAAFGGAVHVVDWDEREAALAGAALLVNTTKLGMIGEAPLDLRLDELPQSALVCDIVYNPLQTPLLAAARARGNPAVGGLGMLLHQARPAFEVWFGVAPEISPELRAAVEATIV